MEDEVEFIDILKIFWRWRRSIVAGTLLCVLVTGVISALLPKIYRISMVIRPGIIGINKDTDNVYIDSTENIKALIKAGTFDSRILKAFSASYPKNNIGKINWSLSSEANTNTILVSYDTDHIEQGIFLLNSLYKNLVIYYEKEVTKHKKKYELKIEEINNDLLKANSIISSQKIQLANDQERVGEIEKEIDRIARNTNYLIAERDLFLKEAAKGDSALSAVIYTNTIQQNISYLDLLKGQKTSLLNTISKEKAEIKNLGHDMALGQEKINQIEFNANAVQNIQQLLSPIQSFQPIKPRIFLNVVLSFMVGLMGMIFAAFFLEYIRQALAGGKMNDNSQNTVKDLTSSLSGSRPGGTAT